MKDGVKIFLKGLYEELNEGDGKAILRLKDLEDRHGVLEILKNDPELRVSEPVSLRGMGPSIMIVRKSS